MGKVQDDSILKSFILSISDSVAGNLFHSLSVDGRNEFRQDSVLENGNA